MVASSQNSPANLPSWSRELLRAPTIRERRDAISRAVHAEAGAHAASKTWSLDAPEDLVHHDLFYRLVDAAIGVSRFVERERLAELPVEVRSEFDVAAGQSFDDLSRCAGLVREGLDRGDPVTGAVGRIGAAAMHALPDRRRGDGLDPAGLLLEAIGEDWKVLAPYAHHAAGRYWADVPSMGASKATRASGGTGAARRCGRPRGVLVPESLTTRIIEFARDQFAGKNWTPRELLATAALRRESRITDAGMEAVRVAHSRLGEMGYLCEIEDPQGRRYRLA